MIDPQLLSDPRALGDAVIRGQVPLDDALLAAWAQRAAIPGLMRSGLEQMVRAPARAADGSDGMFVVQANPGRSARRAPGRTFESVVAPFDPKSFHYAPGLVRHEETILELELDGVPCAVLINVSPFGLGHSLLVVDPEAGLAQALEERGVRAALALLRASSRADFKLGFNSLRACATVNHYHLQCMYFRGAGVDRDRMPVELAGDGPELAAGITRLAGYPAPGWRLRGPDLTRLLSGAARVLQDHNTAHNVLLSPEAAVLIPRVAQDAAGCASGFAFLELSGELLVVCGKDDAPDSIVRQATDAQVRRMIAAASLDDEEFTRLERALLQAAAFL